MRNVDGKVCPICGGRIIKKMYYATREYYYECERDGCWFRLKPDYTDEEFALQGRVLKSTCLGCGSPIVMVSGPHGLYPRCCNCNYDREEGHKWGNAKQASVIQEVAEMKRTFKEGLNNEAPVMPEIEEAPVIEETPVAKEETPVIEEVPVAKPKSERKRRRELLDVSNLKKPKGRKEEVIKQMKFNLEFPMTSVYMYKLVKAVVRNNKVLDQQDLWTRIFRDLKNDGLIKMVGIGESESVEYQLIESPLPEVDHYEDGKEYWSPVLFFRTQLKNGVFQDQDIYNYSESTFLSLARSSKYEKHWISKNNGSKIYKNGYLESDLLKLAEDYCAMCKISIENKMDQAVVDSIVYLPDKSMPQVDNPKVNEDSFFKKIGSFLSGSNLFKKNNSSEDVDLSDEVEY